MGFLIPTLLRAALGHPPRLVCTAHVWRAGANELAVVPTVVVRAAHFFWGARGVIQAG